jgi:hypothetical protein
MSIQKRQEDKGFPWGFLIGFIIIMGLVAYYMLKEPNKNFDNLNAFGGRQSGANDSDEDSVPLPGPLKWAKDTFGAKEE